MTLVFKITAFLV